MTEPYPRDLVGYGASPPPADWPDGARLALLPDLPIGSTTPRAPVTPQPQPQPAPLQPQNGGSLVTNVPGQPGGFQVIGSR